AIFVLLRHGTTPIMTSVGCATLSESLTRRVATRRGAFCDCKRVQESRPLAPAGRAIAPRGGWRRHGGGASGVVKLPPGVRHTIIARPHGAASVASGPRVLACKRRTPGHTITGE